MTNPPSEGSAVVDTVAVAGVTPDRVQPFAELGLRAEEYERIRGILGRRPTEAELAMYAVMWSEHCSYKSSKVHLRYFGETTTGVMRSKMLAGIGENAGVVEVGDGWAATFKFESHNHPSFIDPVAGAATGIGGCVRDILAMGARPIAVSGDLFAGALDAADTRRIVNGAARGLAEYGRGLDTAHITGGLAFDPAYAGNPLVNAGCVGVLRADSLHTAQATGVGNVVVLFGAPTGADGIGAAARASAAFDGDDPAASEPAPGQVPTGNPDIEKRLIAATLEAFDAGLISGISDLGAAGLACATSELAAAGEGGMDVQLDTVPLRDDGMTAPEIFCSESQERMCAVVTPGDLDAFLEICARHDIPAAAVGTVTGTGRLRVSYRGELVVDVPPHTVAHDGPVYERPIARPRDHDAVVAASAATLPRPSMEELPGLIVTMAGSPNLASRALVTDQLAGYGNPAATRSAPVQAGVVPLDPSTSRAVVLASGANPHFTDLDPRRGTQIALAEAFRRVAATGATPLAVTNCLCFGSPEDPGVMWQFREAVHGLADGCQELEIPVTGGNVSFYNQSGDQSILPTPIVGVLGVLDDGATSIGPVFGAGPLPEMLFLLGETRDELDGSEWARVVHGHHGGTPPAVDFAAEQRLAGLMAAAASRRMLSAARALGRGGLAQALAETTLLSQAGAAITLPPGDPFVNLFSESTGRILVALPVSQLAAFAELADEHGVPTSALGSVTAKRPIVEVSGVGEIPLDDLRAAWSQTLPSQLG